MILEEKIVGLIPEDENIRNSTLKKMDVIEYNPRCPSSKAYTELALKVTGSYVDIGKIEEIYNESFFEKLKRSIFSKFKK
jgi:septum site-determining protein MinD